MKAVPGIKMSRCLFGLKFSSVNPFRAEMKVGFKRVQEPDFGIDSAFEILIKSSLYIKMPFHCNLSMQKVTFIHLKSSCHSSKFKLINSAFSSCKITFFSPKLKGESSFGPKL